MGIVDADDLGGVPVYMNLKATERAPVLDPKEAEKKEKSMKGIIYNVPGKASIEISMNKKHSIREKHKLPSSVHVKDLPLLCSKIKSSGKSLFLSGDRRHKTNNSIII